MSTFDETKVNRRAKGMAEGGQFDYKDHPANEAISLTPTPKVEVTVMEGPTYNFPAIQLWEARRRIEEANRRLERDGIPERFTYQTKTYQRPHRYSDGVTREATYIELTLSAPSLSYQGYEFLAAVDAEEGGLVVRNALGQDLGGWRPPGQECEHCNLTRNRNLTYLVRDTHGDIKQVGSTCVKSYTGIEPKGLWALGLDPIEGIEDEEVSLNLPREQTLLGVDDVLASALAISEDGKTFTSRTRANDYGTQSTSDKVIDSFRDTHRSEDQERRAEIRREAERRIATGKVKDLRQRIQELPGKSDWEANLKTIAEGEYVSVRNAPTLISAVALLRRDQDKKLSPQWKPGHAGKVGDSLKGRKLKVRKHRVVTEPRIYGYGPPITKSQLVFADEEGHQVVWWASREIDVKEGQEVTVGSGKVKKHGTYRGTDQTVVERVRLL